MSQFTLNGVNLVPLSPVDLLLEREVIDPTGQNAGSDNTILSGVARSRYVQDPNWSTATAARMADPPSFSIDLSDGTQTKTVLRQSDSPAFRFVFSAAELTQLFGAAPAQLSGSICQVSAQVGKGHLRTFAQS